MVGVDVGIYAVSVVIYKAMKWNCQLCENRSSLVRNTTFRFPDLKVVVVIIIIIHATWHGSISPLWSSLRESE